MIIIMCFCAISVNKDHYILWLRWLSGKALDLRSLGRGFEFHRDHLCINFGQVVYTYVPLSPSSITWY